MKKHAALVFACFVTASAFAQSGVTLYGFMDLGIAYTSNNANSGLANTSSTSMRSGNFDYSHWGLRGSEDLGGGTSAIFTLESAINAVNGDPYSAYGYPFFARQAWVGLKSGGLGQITLGRQLPIASDILVPTANAYYLGSQTAAIDGAASVPGSAVNRFDNMIGGVRLNNLVKYRSSAFSGVIVHAQFAPEEKGTTVATAAAGIPRGPDGGAVGQTSAIGATYGNDVLDLGLMAQTVKCLPSVCALGYSATDKLFGLSAAYKMGASRFGFMYTNQKNAKNSPRMNGDTFSALATVPYGSWRFSAGYQYLKDKSGAKQNVGQFNLGVNYGLSKRTFLYALYSRQDAKNGGLASMAGVISSDGKQSQVTAGIAHAF